MDRCVEQVAAVNPYRFQSHHICQRICRRLLFLLAVLVLNVVGVESQDLAAFEQGVKPYGAYHGSDIDSISMVNGSLSLRIPLISYPQRGGALKLGFSVIYRNPFYTNTDNCYNNPDPNCVPNKWTYHLTYGAPYPSGGGAPVSIVNDFGPTVLNHMFNGHVAGLEIHEPDGVTHLMSGISIDATGYSYSYNSTLGTYGTGILIDRHGVRYYVPYASSGSGNVPTGIINKIEDANGNILTPNTDQLGRQVSWTDTMGRVIPVPTFTTTTDYTGCTGSLTTDSAFLWTPPGPSGGTSQFKLCNARFPVSYIPPGCGTGCTGVNASELSLQSIVLPNGTAWTFALDSHGSLSKITLPTGGSISYTWNINTPSGCFPPPDIMYDYASAATSRTVDANDGTGGHKWTYALTWPSGKSQTVVTDPNLNDAVHTESFLGSCSAYETELDQYSGSYIAGTLLKKTATTYSSVPYPLETQIAANVAPLTVTTTDVLSGKASKIAMTYDAGVNVSGTNIIYGDVLTRKEYDFDGSLLRNTVNTYMAFTGPNATSYLANNLISLPYTVQVQNGGGTQVSLTQYKYDETARASSSLTSSYQFDTAPPSGNYRGNKTSVLRWLNSGTFTCPSGTSGGSSGNLISKKTYFDDGMLNTTADPCANTTTYAYSLTYWGALPTTITNSLSQKTTNVYDFNTGLLTSSTDPNTLVTSHTYDSLWRPLQTTHPDSSLDTDTVAHQEASTPFTATVTSMINTAQSTAPLTVFDGLGRTSQTQLTTDPQGKVYTDTTYDALGRVATVTNPYRTGTDSTTSSGRTTYGYDALSRKTSETYADNAVLTTAYCGPSTLVTDPTGKWRRSRVDGLGRLVEIDEPNSLTAAVASTGCPGTNDPIWVTTYTYNALGDLMSVVQNGSRNRTFAYDSLSRLLTAANPENGTITYTYNPDGTLLTKKDARSITTCFGDWSSSTSTCTASTGYDALHRVLKTTYSNGDPTLTFAYDGTGCLSLSACQNIGHRTGMTDGAGSESWAYEVDKTNNRSIHREQRTTNSITKTTTYYLDFQGNVTQIFYPTGRTVNYTYNAANRPSTAADSSNGITYVTGWKTPPASTACTSGSACYTPQGSLYAMSVGQTSSFTGLNMLETFNSRLQPNEIKASSTAGTSMDLTYSFNQGTTGPNAGHLGTITNNLDNTRSEGFAYDQLNRLSVAGTVVDTGSNCWGYQYNYDAWGNLLAQAAFTQYYSTCTQGNMAAVLADNSNHISALSYDLSGNTNTDGVESYTWNGESQLKTAGGVTYTYDGDGRRASKVGSKLYWYGSGGEILAETDSAGNLQNEYVYFGGRRVAMVPASGSALYYAEDFLGSSRVIVQSNGTLCYDADFTPFGAERVITNTCPQNYKFEGKERDTETGNDDFGAREYSWRFGRWLSSDWSAVPVPVPYANLTNPQTLNLYSMVADDPESFADLDGHAGFWSPEPTQPKQSDCGDDNCYYSWVKHGSCFDGRCIQATNTAQKKCPADACVTAPMPQGPDPVAVEMNMRLFMMKQAQAAGWAVWRSPYTQNVLMLIVAIATHGEGGEGGEVGGEDVGGEGEAPEPQSEPGTAKDRSPQGTEDQLKDMEREQKDYRRGRRRRPVDSIEKSKQNLKKSVKDNPSVKDWEQ
jgi:RHS repeat-associated protein